MVDNLYIDVNIFAGRKLTSGLIFWTLLGILANFNHAVVYMTVILSDYQFFQSCFQAFEDRSQCTN